MFEDWKQVQLGELVEKAFSGPSPTCEERNLQSDNEWGVLKTTSVTWSGWNAMAHKTLPENYWGLEDLEVKAGDVIVTKAGPRHRVGVVAYVDKTIPHLIVSGKMVGLRIKPDTCLPDVLAGLLSTREPQTYLDHRTTGMAESQVNFANSALLNAPLRVPPKSEQEVISSIGHHLDTQIQKTEALIAKLEKVKEGLLHDLLTRGIDENGQLRPSPEQAPELYKDSPLGVIPREWEVKRLGVLIDGIDAGWSPSCSDVAPKEGEWGVLKVSAISTGAYLPHNSKTLPEGLSPIKEIEVNSGDVICVRANGVAELVGKTAYVSFTPRRLMLSDKTLRLRAGKSLDPLFLFLLMGSAGTRKQIASLISGSSGQKNLSQNQIKSIQVKAPSIEEQRRVAGALSSMASRIEKEKSARDSSATLKAGLMDDLLTGRVRVTPLLEHAETGTPA